MEKFELPLCALSSNCLANQVILITGASSGIGRTLAFHAAKHGATTILLGKSVKKLESLFDEIVQAGYPEPAIHPLNLLRTEPAQANELAMSIHKLFGRLDAVVHNAGTFGRITPLEHLAPDKWQEVIQLNLNIPYLLTHSLLPLLKNTPFSSILFTVAEEAFQPKAYWSAYSASKSGVLALAKSLHEELEENTTIRVNCIHPGIVRTASRLLAYPGIAPACFVAPEAIIEHYIYLLSPQAQTLRGKCITLENTHLTSFLK